MLPLKLNKPNTLFSWLAYLEKVSQSAKPNSVEELFFNAKRLARQLGITQPAARVITITGTNGKGSVSACLEQLCLAAGLQVACLTSPHLLRFNERLRINGQELADEAIAQVIAQVVTVAKELNVLINYFQVVNLACLLLIPDYVEVLVLEVGVGGRFDPINLIDCDVAVITTIDLDHTQLLGETREAIAFEKAGILREGKPVVIGELHPPANLLELAASRQARAYQLGVDFRLRQVAEGWVCQLQEQELLLSAGSNCLPVNQGIALMGFSLLCPELPISQQFVKVLSNFQVPGRCQVIDRRPRYLLDVAHNTQAIKHLANQINLLKPKANKVWAIFSGRRNKQLTEALLILKPLIDEWLLPHSTDTRAYLPEDLQQLFHPLGITCYHRCTHFKVAYERVAQQAANNDLIVVFGSFIVVGAIMNELDLENAQTERE